jgi:hypothetical protein
MAKTHNERQKAYRDKMYESGYKQVQIWVPRESEGKKVKIERRMFAKQIDSLTVGWGKTRLSRLFKDVLNYVAEKIKQGGI